MAITTTPLGSELILVMDNGVGASGQQLTKNRTYRDVKPDASNENLYLTAGQLISLQQRMNVAVNRRDLVCIEDI
ncbi:MAG: DUF1659 domain-containing protein [Syntrophomonadaceae bacterium]|jgi:hypothetical protein